MNQRIITVQILVTEPTEGENSFNTLDIFKEIICDTIINYTDVSFRAASIIKLVDEPSV